MIKIVLKAGSYSLKFDYKSTNLRAQIPNVIIKWNGNVVSNIIPTDLTTKNVNLNLTAVEGQNNLEFVSLNDRQLFNNLFAITQMSFK
jgi:hypothetical protein